MLAQIDSTKVNYYIFPIKPGVRNTLAGTMGELRSSHFHTGIDIRTGGVQGVPVQAAADGHLIRVVVSPGGYGNALYLRHPNGEVTVYAHLKKFSPEIQHYVRSYQYANQTFRVNLFPKAGQFEFNQGDTIAISGNSGSSGGPHLHFDIRDENQNVLNPLKYGFSEVEDIRAPIAKTIAFKTADIDSRVNGQFGRFEFDLTLNNQIYEVTDTIRVWGKLAMELFAYDRQNNTRFRTGISKLSVELDDKPAFGLEIDYLSFSKSREFYHHVNFEEIIQSGRRFHKLYRDEGSRLDFYTTDYGDGILDFKESGESIIEIEMIDTYGNSSKVLIPVKSQPPEATLGHDNTSEIPEVLEPKVIGNVIQLTIDKQKEDEELKVWAVSNGMSFEFHPSYSFSNNQVYLGDLTTNIPSSFILSDTLLESGIDFMIPSNTPYQYYGDKIEANFQKSTLFDTLYLKSTFQLDTTMQRELFTIGGYSDITRGNVKMKLKTEYSYDHNNSHVYAVHRKDEFEFKGGTWVDSGVEFSTRNLGTFTILTDSLAPAVKPLIINQKDIIFKISDELSGIKEFNLLVNGAWVLMNYDPKLKRIWSEKYDSSIAFEGPLTLSVVDNAGNENLYETKIEYYGTKGR